MATILINISTTIGTRLLKTRQLLGSSLLAPIFRVVANFNAVELPTQYGNKLLCMEDSALTALWACIFLPALKQIIVGKSSLVIREHKLTVDRCRCMVIF